MNITKESWHKLFKGFNKLHSPKLPCHECGKAGISISKEQKVALTKPSKTQGKRRTNAFDAKDSPLLAFINQFSIEFEHEYWKLCRFTAISKCTYCQEGVVISGVAKTLQPEIRELIKDHPKINHQLKIYPEFFSPPLQIIEVHRNYPDSIRKLLIKSFQVAFCEPASAAICLRKVIENLLDQQKIPRCDKKDKILPLYNRINRFKNGNNVLGKVLEAIKVIGDDGAHTNQLTEENLLEAYRLLNFVLQQLYVKLPEQNQIIEQATNIVVRTKQMTIKS